VAAGFLFWWPVIDPAPRHSPLNYLARVPYLFAAVGKIALAAVLAFSAGPLYGYADVEPIVGLTPPQDRVTGAYLMLTPSTMMFAVVAAGIVALMLMRRERNDPAWARPSRARSCGRGMAFPRRPHRYAVDDRRAFPQYLCMSADTHISSGPIPDDQVDLAVEVFRMLADATRVRLLWALLDQELPVNDLAAAVHKAPNAVSQHLAKLRMARLVRARREGTFVFYRIENDHVRQLVRDAISHADHASGGVHHLRVVDARDA